MQVALQAARGAVPSPSPPQMPFDVWVSWLQAKRQTQREHAHGVLFPIGHMTADFLLAPIWALVALHADAHRQPTFWISLQHRHAVIPDAQNRQGKRVEPIGGALRVALFSLRGSRLLAHEAWVGSRFKHR